MASASSPFATSSPFAESLRRQRLENLEELMRNWAITDLTQIFPPAIAPRIDGDALPAFLSRADIDRILKVMRIENGAANDLDWFPSAPIPVLKYTISENGPCVRNTNGSTPGAGSGWESATIEGMRGLFAIEQAQGKKEVLEPHQWSNSLVHALKRLSRRTVGDLELARAFLVKVVEGRRLAGTEINGAKASDVREAVERVKKTAKEVDDEMDRLIREGFY